MLGGDEQVVKCGECKGESYGAYGFLCLCSDQLFRTMADIVVAEGYAAVGYDYINVDDCWLEKDRDFNGQLVPDRQRFPYGMKSLADYVIQCYLHL